ncbi:beta-glucanase, partial [Akkermansia sp. BIOML-A14]
MTNIISPLLSILLFCGAAVLSPADVPVRHTSFKPGEIWTDNNGVHI